MISKTVLYYFEYNYLIDIFQEKLKGFYGSIAWPVITSEASPQTNENNFKTTKV